MRRYYKFQFNNDEISCEALASMIIDGWLFDKSIDFDGYTWFMLYKLGAPKI